MPRERLAVVVLGYGHEPLLLDCLSSVRPQLAEGDELILVDNGISGDLRLAAEALNVRILGHGHNIGFAGGCNLGGSATDAAVLVFLNSDAVLRPGALDALVAPLDDPAIGIVGGCLRLADQPDLVNSVGNPLHYLGFTWAGHCGEPASAHDRPGPVAVATGGLFAVSHRFWDDLGGFDPEYFAYHEDTDLSLRTWLSGREVRVEPAAVAVHAYEFSRHPRKMYLVERNRLITVLCDYPTPLLRRVIPALLVVELPLLAVAILSGWGPQKLAAWWWVLRRWRWLTRRRRDVQRQVNVPTSVIAALLTAEIAPPMLPQPPGMGLLNAALRRYWGGVYRSLG
ncbi:MAG: glycosyltransferase family 2 protein [Microlunatus sp.]|nr:glycosyltransferase family 2 protein [Microlunatus sp.]